MTFKNKAATLTGESWTRCARMLIFNQLGSTPSLMVTEERAAETPSGTVTSPYREFVIPFVPAATFDGYDQTTGQKDGTTFTHADVQKMLWSVYMSGSVARDAAIAAQVASQAAALAAQAAAQAAEEAAQAAQAAANAQ